MLGCPGREEVKPPHHHRVECLGRHMCIRGSRTVFLWSYCPFFPCSNRRQTREARLGHGSNCLVLTRRLDHWYGNTHTHTHRGRLRDARILWIGPFWMIASELVHLIQTPQEFILLSQWRCVGRRLCCCCDARTCVREVHSLHKT